MFQSRFTNCVPLLLSGLMVSMLAGCQTYAPYGYSSYPGNYGYPQQSYPPGTVLPAPAPLATPGAFPNSAVIPPGQGFPATGGYPANGAPPFNPQANPNYQLPAVTPNPGASMPPPTRGVDLDGSNFGQPQPFPGTTTPPTSSRPRMPPDERMPVPNYPEVDTQPTTGATTGTRSAPGVKSLGEEGFQDGLNNGRRESQKLKTIETEDEAAPAAAIPKKSAMLEPSEGVDDSSAEFLPPVTPPIAQREIIQTAQHVERTPAHRPYGRAGDGHSWFRGVVDFDEQERTWYLIYNPSPDEDDERGGIITLLEHPQLRNVRSADTVLIEGNFEPTQTDRYGHPRYQAHSIKLLVPPQ